MFHHLASVSSVCLLLAFAGWDRDGTKMLQDDTDSSVPETFADKYYNVDTRGPWSWLFGEGSIEAKPCLSCWGLSCFTGGLFRSFGGRVYTDRKSRLHDAGIFSWVFYNFIYSVEDLGSALDKLAVGNAVWLLISTGVHLTIYRVHSGGWTGLLELGLKPKRQTKDSSCQKNSNIYRKIQLLRQRHRRELEEMARTIEYLQREQMKQQASLEQKMIEVDTLQNAIRHLYHAHAEGDGEKKPEFEHADYEWDNYYSNCV